MTTFKVQDCGCIALPEEIQQRTGLFPNAIFRIAVAADGSSVTLQVEKRGDAALIHDDLINSDLMNTACPIPNPPTC